ncbi:uncharacterized protein ACRADG_009808 [Cochliomyia hominivorax]
MSKVIRNENLKINKQGTKILKSDTGENKSNTKTQITKKSYTSSKLLKPSEEKDKSKVVNGSTSISNKTNISVQKANLSETRTIRNDKPKINLNLKPRKDNSLTVQKKPSQPLRAKVSTRETKSTSKITSNKSITTKPNAVLDTPHNVTVSSPPPKRINKIDKQTKNESESQHEAKSINSKLTRKGSRTLAPEEIVILKREQTQKRIEEKIQHDDIQLQREQTNISLSKEPIAFEVKFEGKRKKSTSGKSSAQELKSKNDAEFSKETFGTKFSNNKNSERERSTSRSRALNVIDKNEEEQNYSDDFDSYESDFETDSTTHSMTTTHQSSSGDEDVSDEIENRTESISNLTSNDSDSEITQNPITVIQREKENKLDSGHYELNSRNTNVHKTSELSLQSYQAISDSVDTFSIGISDQMDSGISTNATLIYHTPSHNTIIEVFYGGYKDFNTKPVINKRGFDLLAKIQFDIIGFTLLDLKPVSYDIFMQTFGKLNTNQSSTQTQNNQSDVEQQTELEETRSMWTQHPAQYDLENLSNNYAFYNENSCGEFLVEIESQSEPKCVLERSLFNLKNLNNKSSQRKQQNYQKRLRKPVDYENLNTFLLRSSFVLDHLLGISNTNNKAGQHTPYECDTVISKVSDHYFQIETNFLNTLQVINIFSSNKYNLLITVHESLPDTNVYSSDFTQLLMVWCTNAYDKPIRLLTTWSEVSKVDISNDSSDIIVAALRDGSIALWDLRETHSFCSKLDGYLTHFAATQSLIPTWNGIKNESKSMLDLGACLDIKSFRSQLNNLLLPTKTFAKTQFVSLHDSGIVTVWTLVETSEANLNLPQIKKIEKTKYSTRLMPSVENTSPWARVKLMQSTTVNLKHYLEMKSQQLQTRFDKTKQFFQKDIYSDEALKELHEHRSEMGQQGLRFTSVECGSENVFICTNRNYILMCSKSLKIDKLKRIMINESRFLFPTALKILSNEYFLAVGLSNGAVMILNCQPNKIRPNMDVTNPSYITEDALPSPNRDSFFDSNSIIGKSCAIQNIVLNSQKSNENKSFEKEYRPNTAACIALIESRQKPFELRIFDQQIIMSGLSLRKNLIQTLELSSDGWQLFALANGHIRIYDFYLDQEINCEQSVESGNIINIATGKCGSKEKTLIILKPHKEIEVYILNK